MTAKWTGQVPSAVVATLGGLALSVQARINGQLGDRLGDGVLAALISFGGGLVLLAIFVPLVPSGRRGVARVAESLRTARGSSGGGLRWWQCLGGLCGAFLVAAQGVTITALGVAVFTVAVVGGQVVSGLAVDRIGVGPSGVQALTWPRALGAAIAVLAVVVSVSGEFGRPTTLWLVALPALAGVGLAWQLAVNGRVRAAADNAFVAALVNFGVGMTALAVVSAIDLVVRGWPGTASGQWPAQWWWYSGGALGILVVASAAMAVRAIGVLLLGLCSVAGQLLGALLLDLVVPAQGERLAPAQVAGTVITLCAVAVAALPARRRFERMAS